MRDRPIPCLWPCVRVTTRRPEKLGEKQFELVEFADLVLASWFRGQRFVGFDEVDGRPAELVSSAGVGV